MVLRINPDFGLTKTPWPQRPPGRPSAMRISAVTVELWQQSTCPTPQADLMGFSWNLIGFNGDYYGLLWIIMDYYGLLWIIMDYYGLLWIIMDYYGLLWIIVDYYGLLWIIMDYYGFLWIIVDYYGLLWIIMDYYSYLFKIGLNLFVGFTI